MAAYVAQTQVMVAGERWVITTADEHTLYFGTLPETPCRKSVQNEGPWSRYETTIYGLPAAGLVGSRIVAATNDPDAALTQHFTFVALLEAGHVDYILKRG